MLLHVPYRRMAPVVSDLITGNVSIMFGNPAPLLPQVRSGRLRALATAGPKRSQVIPELPTLAYPLPAARRQKPAAAQPLSGEMLHPFRCFLLRLPEIELHLHT